MTDKFTKGEWTLDEYENVNDENGRTIRIKGVALASGDEPTANAHLVSAAPDLLESLRYMLLSAENGWLPDASSIFHARAAIKKATNQSN